MKVLVYPHDLGIGGSQLNAIEIAAAVQRLGHETVVFGRPGPLLERIGELGLEFIAAPAPRRRPSPAVIRALLEVIDNRGIDILHGYEWPPALECLLASRARRGTVAVSTVMSMAVAPFIPKSMPMLVGTNEIAETEREAGRATVALLEPPVDVEANRPDYDIGQAEFRREWGLDPRKYTVVMVSRLAHELKLEGILSAMEAVAVVARSMPVCLVIAGSGPAQAEVAARAAEINLRTKDRTVILTGELLDPRPAYSVADVALGMGGSALRAMAFAKPLVVQGENGFWELLTPGSLSSFLWQGWYGVGEDAKGGTAALAEILSEILPARHLRTELGAFSLRTVRDRFSVQQAARTQEEFYAGALNTDGHPARSQDFAAAGRFVRYEVARRVARITGRLKSDDFNAKPVAGLRATSSGGGVPAL